MGQKVKVREIFSGTNGAITKNGDITSEAVDLRDIGVDGNFALHTIHAGGDITVTVLVCSTAAGTFVAPTTPVEICADFAAGTGYWAFSPPVTPFMKLKFAENNTAAVTSLDAWLNHQ